MSEITGGELLRDKSKICILPLRVKVSLAFGFAHSGAFPLDTRARPTPYSARRCCGRPAMPAAVPRHGTGWNVEPPPGRDPAASHPAAAFPVRFLLAAVTRAQLTVLHPTTLEHRSVFVQVAAPHAPITEERVA
jgi:hypothetical protein